MSALSDPTALRRYACICAREAARLAGIDPCDAVRIAERFDSRLAAADDLQQARKAVAGRAAGAGTIGLPRCHPSAAATLSAAHTCDEEPRPRPTGQNTSRSRPPYSRGTTSGCHVVLERRPRGAVAQAVADSGMDQAQPARPEANRSSRARDPGGRSTGAPAGDRCRRTFADLQKASGRLLSFFVETRARVTFVTL